MKTTFNIIFMSFILVVSALAAPVPLSFHDSTGVAGNYIDIPVYVGADLDGSNVIAFQLEINYNAAYLRFESVEETGTLSQSLGNVVYNQTAANRVKVSAAGSSPLSGSGVLVYLRFLMLRAGAVSVAFTDTLNNYFNEGKPSVTLTNATIRISDPPVIRVTPDQAIVAPGDQATFYVSGGVAPYQWRVTDPSVASIDSIGITSARLTGVSPGSVWVIAEDNNGIIDSTNQMIVVRPFKLTIRDTSMIQGHQLDLPVYITDLTGKGVVSGTFTLTYPAVRLEAVDVIHAGTMLAGYAKPQFNVGNGNVKISFAGNVPLSGEGILLYVRLQSNTSNYGNSQINITDIVFNEELLATVDYGWCNVLQLPIIQMSPRDATLITGDTQQFAVTQGGVGPIEWSTSSPLIATIDQQGLLTTHKSGSVVVTVKDSLGSTASSNPILIYDTRVIIPDTTAFISAPIYLPIRIEALPAGQEFLSLQGRMVFDTTAFALTDVVTAGTIGEGWSYAVNQLNNGFVFAGAGVSGVSESGTLLFLRFWVKPNAVNNRRYTIQVQDFMLNEGTPAALVINGALTTIVPGIPPAPGLISPVNGANNVLPDNARFCWRNAFGAQQYHLQIATDVNFTSITKDQTGLTDTCVTLTDLGDETTYYWRVNAGNTSGTGPWSVSWSFLTLINGIWKNETGIVPDNFALKQNYPNPFNPSTAIEFSLPQTTSVVLEVFNSIGERIDQVFEGRLPAGIYTVQWQPQGSAASGTYFYRIRAGNFTQVKKMLLIR